MLRAMLDQGLDPNELYNGPIPGASISPWSEFVRQLIPYPALEEETLPMDYPREPFLEAVNKGVFKILLDHHADCNMLIEDDNRTPEPLPVWANFFLACFVAPRLTSGKFRDHYIRDLEFMLKQANLDIVSGYFQPLGKWIVGESQAAINQCLGVPITFRRAGWNIIRSLLEKVSRERPKDVSFRDIQFYARVTRVFVSQATDATLPMAEIEPILRRSLPPRVIPPILDGLGTVEGHLNNVSGLKRSIIPDQLSDTGQAAKRRAITLLAHS